ncbi:metallo-peptidase, Clan ME, Family M16, putative [Trypanosoma brucei gambiense DAL972]|uniref:Metallo-peptidase, Clan ME, Family M16, putative n=2 Tax=Trypanosoma brucei TaxID=5691 RepID=C9ZNM7_TRYB9|nr:metallo-peptidase, Clan ME, Family M16, putative [Trypanosoma brucei gambiense DAL972]RHW72327.1 mitochondrial processing peptidase [Trypanosoma brucei equiperdum]CBH11005.1 metallo-peptidase, Clan ME, Family M16, putative [Trypanosoma brucei gambiense DAL972]|eukprot:XP_011773292.1 metallo-peptidase, Clan ME, Family M16, putative [Trypanosoma brucei gambiense DAL972]
MSVSFSTLIQRSRPSSNHATTKLLSNVLAKIPPTTLSTVGSGVRVACEENPIASLATVGVWLNAGTRHEPAQYAGTARVLQKCGFLGTSNQTAAQIAAAVDELGGQLTANVGREHTHLYMRVAREDTERAVSLLADVVRNARLSDEDVEVAKQAVLRDQHDFEQRPDDICMDNLHRCAFDSTTHGPGTPLYGTEVGTTRLSNAQLREYRDKMLSAGRVVVVGSGAVNHTALERAATSAFGDLQKGTVTLAGVPEARFVGGEYKLWNLRYKTVHIGWAFETCGAACEDSLPLALACEVPGPFHRSQHELGQHAMHRVLKTFSSLDHSTPTNTHFNEKCIEIANPFLHQYKDTGLCGMYVVGRPAQAGPGDGTAMIEVFQYTIAEWCRICQKILHEQELAQAKVNLKSQLLFNMDGSSNSAEDIGRQVLHYGRRIPLEEMYARIDDVTPTNVQEVLQHYFYGRKPVYSYLGYCANIPGYDWTQHWSYKYWY